MLPWDAPCHVLMVMLATRAAGDDGTERSRLCLQKGHLDAHLPARRAVVMTVMAAPGRVGQFEPNIAPKNGDGNPGS